MIQNKQEIKVYFETHNIEPKEVAKLYNIKYRTLMHWIKEEGWERGKALQNLSSTQIQKNLVKTEICSALEVNQRRIKETIRQNLGDCAESINALVLNNILDSSSEEILLQTMSANYIQKNIALSAIIAKDELMKMVRLRREDKGDPMLIACAEKVNKIFIDMQNALYGKEIPKEAVVNEYENLSTEELQKIIDA
ncbi:MULTISPECIES: hypothetical protein [Helicobacter]|uniref:hypothetical protein n=1 Tax=Helicobacter TaxID=209 RepID=UPI002625D609|nr:hypothetical protein [Helicobacter sp. UBA3407]